jgi:hypothetical protein
MDESTTVDDGPPNRNKVIRVINEYALDGLGEELERRWLGVNGDRESLRDLAETFNQAVLEAALKRAGEQPVDGEIQNYYRLLTADNVNAAARTQAETRLDRQGIDPDAAEAVGEAVLEALGPEGVLVNLARGEVVDEEALVRALQEDRIRGAALDVFREEPLPPSSPLWSLENVLVTPHTSGVSPRVWDRQTDLILENVRRYLAGEPPLNEVDKERGY